MNLLLLISFVNRLYQVAGHNDAKHNENDSVGG